MYFEFLKDLQIATFISLILACLFGVLIGNIRLFNVKIGITGALFGGIILSYLGFPFNGEIINFLRDLGLVFFVYAVGVQVGSGFFNAFRKNGISLNVFVIIVVILNIIAVVVLGKLFGFQPATIIGVYCGAVTNTPSLAATHNMLSELSLSELIQQASSGYAIAYPGAIFAIIIAMILLRRLFPLTQSDDVIKKQNIVKRTIIVENKNLDGVRVKDIPAMDELRIVVTRVKKGDNLMVALDDTYLNIGDLILAVGQEDSISEFEKIVGRVCDVDISQEKGSIINTRAVVTNRSIIGKKIHETKIPSFDVVITRVSRSDVEFIATDDYEIEFGDNLVIVGESENVYKAVSYIGNSPKELNHPNLLPIFVGMFFGIIIGNIPFKLPFVSHEIKLGLAGGQLISAIIFSNIGHIGRVSWYMPPAANLMMREIGIVIFLSCVGLKSGHSFFDTLISRNGLVVVIVGFLVSFIPVFLTGLLLVKFLRFGYTTAWGFMSGSMTDPPALAWAQNVSNSPHVSMAYASVYPLTMFLRIISAQILVLIFYG